MAFVQVAFGPNPMAKVGPFGLKLPTLVGTYSLDETSCFEPPMSVEARVNTPTAIEVGAFTSIAAAGKIGNVKVGRYCAIAPEVKIGAHEHPTDWLTCSRVTYYPEIHNWDQFCKPDQMNTIRRQRRPFANSCPITTLGHDVWIGQGPSSAPA